MLEFTSTDKAPAAIGPYSQAARYQNLLFTSGQIPLDPVCGKIVPGGIQEQTLQVMKNLQAILEANQTNFSHTIKTTCFLANMEDFQAFNEVYSQYFKSNPARSCVAAKELPRKVLCEIELIAMIP